MAKILVVDDEVHIIRFCQVNLQKAGHHVITALNGHEALEKISTENPDLIVLDVAMPGVSGIDVLAIVRQQPETTDLPVVIMTAKSIHSVIKASQFALLGESMLEKPFDPQLLLNIVQRLLDLQDA